MSNDRATQMITSQIAKEIRELNSIITDEADKPAIVQRIAALKAMLDTEPSVKTSEPPTTRELIADFISAIRNR